ncbi:uncharacterized protein K489DRAFT_41398 [Dissoconium aciculare CBS 342.82]|uniref:Uncharacterized protein n=1 Tax=Dissoconium aciculare CBS 342.82 TaxID=1314786 RepID=A0A6J3LZQ2_9PEZI|nr:uncharacterized protein K489DRAFT_41398 [Dissoconium aciculare CBS 342.82]KAF1820734.1 hypothetical protein K489DRAFT_41398 [Dissoconium aciculare CBS 342.82]
MNARSLQTFWDAVFVVMTVRQKCEPQLICFPLWRLERKGEDEFEKRDFPGSRLNRPGSSAIRDDDITSKWEFVLRHCTSRSYPEMCIGPNPLRVCSEESSSPSPPPHTQISAARSSLSARFSFLSKSGDRSGGETSLAREGGNSSGQGREGGEGEGKGRGWVSWEISTVHIATGAASDDLGEAPRSPPLPFSLSLSLPLPPYRDSSSPTRARKNRGPVSLLSFSPLGFSRGGESEEERAD